MASKSTFLDKVLGRIGRLDAQGLQTVVQRLARERTFLEMLFNTIEDGVLVVDEAGRILYFNQAVTLLMGIQGGIAEGQPITRWLPELDWTKLSAMDRTGGQGVLRQEFEVGFPRPRFIRMYATPLDGESTGSAGVAFILHDATEARQQTFAAIESERIQALTLLAGSVAHEIGNPLNALSVHLQLIERELRKTKTLLLGMTGAGRSRLKDRRGGQEDPAANCLESVNKIDKYVGVARGEIDRLDNVVTQYLQAIRPSPPKLKLAFVNEVLQETLDLLRPEMENRGQTIREKLGRQLPAALFDPAQIKQVLVNLMRNAMQAMTKGGVLTVQTYAGNDGIWISVADTGGGIPQEQLNRIFEPFYTTKKKGSGLGLMIVQRILREHGGRLELESHVGHGTTFRIWLPLHQRQTRLLEAPLHD